MLELAALPFVKRYMKSSVKDIIGILDRHNASFTLFPILSFLLLACYAIQGTFLVFNFITLILSTMLIFFTYYLIATSISRSRIHQELERISMTDSLTGLYNRRYLEQKILQEYRRYENTGVEFALVIADIDFFKNINDLYGHDCGDSVLKSITEDIGKAIRTYDAVARWGGEEFLLLLPATNRDQAITLAERVRKTVEARKFEFDSGKRSVTVTLTLGVSIVSSGDTIDSMIKRADMALYHGKRKSRNCVISFDEINKTLT
jgi:diguanylate cyclase (GGDEF)-like protein